MFFKYCMLVVCLLSTCFVYAAENTVFQLTPAVCMVQNSADVCQIKLNFEWEIETPANVCILRDQTPLKCWQDATNGNFSYKADVQFGTVYSLVNRKSGEKIATAKVKVQSSNSKFQRKRLRTPWSFF